MDNNIKSITAILLIAVIIMGFFIYSLMGRVNSLEKQSSKNTEVLWGQAGIVNFLNAVIQNAQNQQKK